MQHFHCSALPCRTVAFTKGKPMREAAHCALLLLRERLKAGQHPSLFIKHVLHAWRGKLAVRQG